MDTTDAIRLVSGAVLITVGVSIFYLARYLSASEENKKRIAQALKIIGIVWISAGAIFYLVVLLTHVI